jgi:large subunit ribosomal protein L23
MRYHGKEKTRYTKSRVIAGHAPSFKKAIVTVKEGDVIDFYGSI